MGGKSSKSKKPKDAAPLDVLVEGAIIFLTSKASGKLRVNEGNLDAQGEEGESAQFTVGKKDSESGHVVTLQHGEKYVSVTEEKVELCDESSELKVVEGEEGCVSFESVKTAGHYLSVQEDGSVQSGSELGSSTHFTVASAVKKEEPQPAQAAEDTTEPAKEETGQEQETNAAVENKEGEQKEAEEPPKQQEGQEEQTPSES